MLNVDKDYEYADFQPSKKEYIIKPYDKLKVIVTTNEGQKLINIEGGMRQQGQQFIEYLVEFDGLVKLPVIGRVKIDSLTIRQAEAMLEKKYSVYFQKPMVYVEVTNRKVIIFRDAGTQGAVLEIPPENITLVEAIAQTGGLSEISKSYRIRLIRGNLTENPKVYIYNLYNLKDLQNTNLMLEANDIIYIESKPRYVSRVLEEMSPYLNLISTALIIVGYFTLK